MSTPPQAPAPYTATYQNNGLKSHQVFPGAILWLPDLHDVKRFRQREGFHNDKHGGVKQRGCFGGINTPSWGLFNHPIIVLSSAEGHRGLEIDFVPMTSFQRNPSGLRTLTPQRQKKYLPIAPTIHHPDGTEPLEFRYGLEDSVCSNASFGTIYRMYWNHAQNFYNGHPGTREPWMLTEKSLEVLLQGIARELPDPHSGDRYWPNAKQYKFTQEEVEEWEAWVRQRKWVYHTRELPYRIVKECLRAFCRNLCLVEIGSLLYFVCWLAREYWKSLGEWIYSVLLALRDVLLGAEHVLGICAKYADPVLRFIHLDQ